MKKKLHTEIQPHIAAITEIHLIYTNTSIMCLHHFQLIATKNFYFCYSEEDFQHTLCYLQHKSSVTSIKSTKILVPIINSYNKSH